MCCLYSEIRKRFGSYSRKVRSGIKIFHDDVLGREQKCLAYNRRFNNDKAAVSSRNEKHHHYYLRLCIGDILPDDSNDIYRLVKSDEFPYVPNCHQCKVDNPDYYEGCIKKIFPVHSQCHKDVHEVEKYLFTRVGKKLLADFQVVVSEFGSNQFS